MNSAAMVTTTDASGNIWGIWESQWREQHTYIDHPCYYVRVDYDGTFWGRHTRDRSLAEIERAVRENRWLIENRIRAD